MLILVLTLGVPGCNSPLPDCRQPGVFCVGLVTETGRIDDRAANQAAWEGVLQAESQGLVDKVAAIETIDSRDYEENIDAFAEAGYDVIVTVGDGMSAATYAGAGRFPDTYFIGADQQPPEEQINIPNLIWLVFREKQLGFLGGALAAAMTQTGKIGAVCGSSAWAPMKLYGEGFIAGAQYTDPEVKTTVTYHDEAGLDETFNDPEWGAKTAISMIDEGTDVVFGVGGTTGSGAIQAAATRGTFVIGADVDEYYLLPGAAGRMLTSVLKLVKPGVADLIEAAKDAQGRDGAFRKGKYYGQVGLASYHDSAAIISEKIKNQMTSVLYSLSYGEYPVKAPAQTP